MLAVLSLSLLLLLAGCECDSPPSVTEPSSQLASSASAPAVSLPVDGNAAHGGEWHATGDRTVRVVLANEAATIDDGDRSLHGKLRMASRRYVLAQQTKGYVAKVKRRGLQVVVKDDEAKVTWTAHIYPDRIELTHDDKAWTVAALAVDRAELRQGTTKVASVELGRDATQVYDAAGQLRFTARGPRPSAGWAVLLIDDIDLLQAYVLVTELLARGR